MDLIWKYVCAHKGKSHMLFDGKHAWFENMCAFLLKYSIVLNKLNRICAHLFVNSGNFCAICVWKCDNYPFQITAKLNINTLNRYFWTSFKFMSHAFWGSMLDLTKKNWWLAFVWLLKQIFKSDLLIVYLCSSLWYILK